MQFNCRMIEKKNFSSKIEIIDAMKKVTTLLMLFFPLLLVAQRKAVFIIADGIPADLIEKLPTPNLHAIARQGALLKAHVGGERGGYSQTPTISAVGYNSLLTSTWVNKHNVWGNDIKAPNYNYWTLFRILKSQRPAATTAVYSTWLENRTLLVGDGRPETGQLKIDFHLDGLERDTIAFPQDKNSEYIHRIDEIIVDSAAACVRANGPDLSWVYLQYTDDMGHDFGNSEPFYHAIDLMDQQVGRIWKAVQYRQEKFGEEWQIFITTDHGRDSIMGKNHGGQSNRERNTWIVTNAKDLNEYSRMNPGIVDIAPTILRFLKITIPRAQAIEMDGIPLTGKLSLVHPTAAVDNNILRLQWQAMEKTGNVKIWITSTNRFKTGGIDDYKLLAEVPVAKGSFQMPASSIPSGDMSKIVWEAPHNTMNRWLNAPIPKKP